MNCFSKQIGPFRGKCDGCYFLSSYGHRSGKGKPGAIKWGPRRIHHSCQHPHRPDGNDEIGVNTPKATLNVPEWCPVTTAIQKVAQILVNGEERK